MKIAYTHSPDDIAHPSAGLLVIAHGKPKSEIERDLKMEQGSLSQNEYEKIIWEISVGEKTEHYKVALNPMIISDDAADFDSVPFREFRNAWIHKNGKIGHDLEKARGLQLVKMRAARKPLLIQLDSDYMQALEKNDAGKMKLVAGSKQALRDVTEPLKNMKLNSIDDVKGAWNKILG